MRLSAEFARVYVRGRCRTRTKEQCARTSLIAYCRSSTVACIVLAMAAHLITIRRHSSLARAPDKTSIEIHAVRHPLPVRRRRYLHRRRKSRLSYRISGRNSKIALENVDATTRNGRREKLHTTSRGTCRRLRGDWGRGRERGEESQIHPVTSEGDSEGVMTTNGASTAAAKRQGRIFVCRETSDNDNDLARRARCFSRDRSKRSKMAAGPTRGGKGATVRVMEEGGVAETVGFVVTATTRRGESGDTEIGLLSLSLSGPHSLPLYLPALSFTSPRSS